jgi:hypothetical protein
MLVSYPDASRSQRGRAAALVLSCFCMVASPPSVTAGVTPTPTRTPLPPAVFPAGVGAEIPGDCNGDGGVTINELITGVNIAVGSPLLDACRAFDANGDGLVTVNELILAVNFALNGPPPSPTPSQTAPIPPSATSTATGTQAPGTVTRIDASSPAFGEEAVALTRETILTFSGPIDPTTVTEHSVRAEFGGSVLAVRLQVSSDARRVSLFYLEPLPSDARIRVLVDGGRLRDARQLGVDADGDGMPGGTGVIEFDTSSLSLIEGTAVCGRVFASHLAEGDANVSVNVPLEGVTIAVEGAEYLFTTTDRFGNFRLDPAPVGRFFVIIVGQTAVADIPEGAFYPFVGKLWEAAPGVETNIGDVYLPLIAADTLQPVSRTENTVVRFPPSVLSDFPDFADVSVIVPADSLFSDLGRRGGSVGLAPVPPDRLPEPLPPGLNFPVVITVQTDGPTNFDQPAPVCFPNLPDPVFEQTLPPNSTSALWSFSHDTGRFEVVGPMTVSADGRLVCTEPGVGIVAPGWHGTQPGVSGNGGKIVGSDDPRCGDGIVQTDRGEQCDEGGTRVGRGAGACGPDCKRNCVPPLCKPCENDMDCPQCESCQADFCQPNPLAYLLPCNNDNDPCTEDFCNFEGRCETGFPIDDCVSCDVQIVGPAETFAGYEEDFSVQGDIGSRLFRWTSEGSPPSSLGDTYTVMFERPGTYTIIADGGTGCRLSHELTVNLFCEVAISGPRLSTFGDQVEMTATGLPAPGRYEWYTTPPTRMSTGSELSRNFPDIGPYRVDVTYFPEEPAGAQCGADAEVEVYPSFEHSLSGNSPYGALVPGLKVLQDEVLRFSTSISPPKNYKFRWSAPTGSPASSLNRDFTTAFATTGTKIITATVEFEFGPSNRTLTKSYSIEVVAREPCDVTIDGPANAMVGELLAFTAMGMPAGGNFDWGATHGSPPAGAGAAFQTTFNRSGTFPIDVAYTLPAPDGRTCSRRINVRVSSPPPPCTVEIMGPEFVEAGMTASYTAAVTPAAAQVVWSSTDAPDVTAPLGPDAPFEHSFESAGEYRVEALAILAGGRTCGRSLRVLVTTGGNGS